MRQRSLLRQAFVLGHPVEHSLSPVLHRAAYDFLGESIRYGSIDTQEDQLEKRFDFARRQGNVCGFSCTMPLKTVVRDFLDRETDLAQMVGTVNTVFWEETRSGAGQLQAVGHNTDVSGIVNSLDWASSGVVSTASCAIIGGGGTAAAALAAIKYLGADAVDVFVRSPSRAYRVVEAAQRMGLVLRLRKLSSFASSLNDYSLVVSTLPAGAADSFSAQITGEFSGILLDVSYDPWPSRLAQAVKNVGGLTVSGKDMLMYQAVDQVKLFTGHRLTDKLDRELAMINTMCRTIGLSERTRLPRAVYTSQSLKRK